MERKHSEYIEKLYVSSYDMLFTYAMALLGSETAAEEAVQESFRIACMKPEALIGSYNPRGWLIKAMRYTVKNMKRTNMRRRENTDLELYEQEHHLVGDGEVNEYAEIEFSDLVTDEEYSMLKWQTLFKIPVRDIAAAMGHRGGMQKATPADKKADEKNFIRKNLKALSPNTAFGTYY